jgi:hypothetical protein
MASLTIRLRVDPATGKKDVIIDYHSDEDALPMEHEDTHRRLVDKLIEGGALAAAELGKIVVRRDVPEGEAAPAAEAEPQAEAERVPGKSG